MTPYSADWFINKPSHRHWTLRLATGEILSIEKRAWMKLLDQLLYDLHSSYRRKLA